MDRDRIVIAEILRPRGNRGEVLARSESDVPGRLANLKQARVQLAGGSDVSVEIEHSWEHQDAWVLKFRGVDSIDAAERFRGADLWIPPAERGTLGDGEFFQSDLLGCLVVDRTTGRQVGPVHSWKKYGGPPLMEVNVDGRDVLIPFVSSACHVDLSARTIALEMPEGLLEL